LTIDVKTRVCGTHCFGTLGKAIGDKVQGKGQVAYIRGITSANLEELKSFCASLATYGGAALFHMQGVTPESTLFEAPEETIRIDGNHLALAEQQLNTARPEEVDFVSLGCPHLSLREVARIAQLLNGRQVKKEFWITTSRPVKKLADQAGYSQVIEAAGAKFAVDTCCVVAPIKGRFKAMLSDSAKACYYAQAKNQFKVRMLPFDEVVEEACQ